MSIIDISKIQMKVLGFNFISDEEERRLIAQHWDDTFFPQHATLLDMSCETKLEDYDNLIYDKIGDTGVAGLEGSGVLLTVFADLRQKHDSAFLETLTGLATYLETTYHCMVSIFLQFGFVGRMGFGSTSDVRDSAKNIVSKNIASMHTRHLMLIDKSQMRENPLHWKKCITLLDIIRRNGSSNIFNVAGNANLNQCVGYIQYKEDNDAIRRKLEIEHTQIQSFINSNGCSALEPCLTTKVQELKNLMDRYQYDPKLQPIHPGLRGPRTVRAFLFFGNAVSPEFLAAKDIQTDAVAETAKGMEKLFRSVVAATIKSPKEELDNLLNEARIGYRLRYQNRFEIESIIRNKQNELLNSISYEQVGALTNPDNQNEPVEPNPAYFALQRKRAIAMVIAEYLGNLLANVSQISIEDMVKLEDEQEDRATDLENELKRTISSRSILDDIISHGRLFGDSKFRFTSGEGANKTHIQFFGAEMEKLVQSHDANISALKIDENGGRLKNTEDSHMKALRLVTVKCSDDLATIDEMLEEASL